MPLQNLETLYIKRLENRQCLCSMDRFTVKMNTWFKQHRPFSGPHSAMQRITWHFVSWKHSQAKIGNFTTNRSLRFSSFIDSIKLRLEIDWNSLFFLSYRSLFTSLLYELVLEAPMYWDHSDTCCVSFLALKFGRNSISASCRHIGFRNHSAIWRKSGRLITLVIYLCI